jgi:hypothetical protein
MVTFGIVEDERPASTPVPNKTTGAGTRRMPTPGSVFAQLPRGALSVPLESPAAPPAPATPPAITGISRCRRYGPGQAGQPDDTERIGPDVTHGPCHDQGNDCQAANQAVQRGAQHNANRTCHVATLSSRVAKTTTSRRPGSRDILDVPSMSRRAHRIHQTSKDASPRPAGDNRGIGIPAAAARGGQHG